VVFGLSDEAPGMQHVFQYSAELLVEAVSCRNACAKGTTARWVAVFALVPMRFQAKRNLGYRFAKYSAEPRMIAATCSRVEPESNMLTKPASPVGSGLRRRYARYMVSISC